MCSLNDLFCVCSLPSNIYITCHNLTYIYELFHGILFFYFFLQTCIGERLARDVSLTRLCVLDTIGTVQRCQEMCPNKIEIVR